MIKNKLIDFSYKMSADSIALIYRFFKLIEKIKGGKCEKVFYKIIKLYFFFFFVTLNISLLLFSRH